MDRYALIIGVSEYQHQRLDRLPKASTDADKVAQILDKHGRYQVKRLPERWNSTENRFEVGNGKVTGAEIGQELETLLLEKATKSDALVYFAGHGFTVLDNLKEQQGFLATSDCQVEIVNNVPVNQKYGISLESLNKLIAKSDLRSLVMLLDCCHSGYFLERQLVQQTLSVFSFQKDYYLITACRNFETAKALIGEPNSIFTGAILKGLATNNADHNGIVTGDRLFDCINTELNNNLARQEPIRLGWGKAIPLVTYHPTEINSNPLPNGVIHQENPYLGLRAFECSDEGYFFGRGDSVRALLDLLNNGRFLAVIGPSGCGKSSLVKAGLLTALKQDKIPGSRHWQIQSLTPGMRPFEALKQALEQPSNQPLLLFIDQFEEVFTLCTNEIERKNFITCLSQETMRSDRMIRVAVAMRGDFLDRCGGYQETAKLINRTQPTTYIVTPLTPKELEEVIEKPAQKHGIEFEWGLVGEIIADVVDQPGALPLLQYALAELWRVCITESTDSHPMLTCQGYQQIGGVKGALEKKADELYQNLAPADQIFVRRLFLELVQLGEGKEVTRRRATWQELAALADSSEQLQRVTRLLAGQQERLIMTDEKTIEVAHEALLTEWRLLLDWIEQDRENIRLSRRLRSECYEWEKHRHSEDSEGLLLTGTWLAAIENWVETTQPKLGKLEQKFLQKSIEKRDKEIQEELAQERELRELAEARQKEAEARAIVEIEKSLEADARAKAEAQNAQEAQARAKAEKRGKQIARISGVVLAISTVVAVGLASWAFWEKNRVVEAQKQEAYAIITKAEELLQTDQQLEALTASTEATKKLYQLKEKNHEQIIKIQNIINRIHEKNRMYHGGHVQSISWHPNGQILASGSTDGTVKIWKLDGTLKETFPSQPTKVSYSPVWGVSLSKNDLVASSYEDGTIKLWKLDGTFIRDLKEPVAFSTKQQESSQKYVFDISFNPEGTMLASAHADATVKLWKSNGDFIRRFSTSDQEIPKPLLLSVAFSSDGQLIASTYADGTVRLWKTDGTLLQMFSDQNAQKGQARDVSLYQDKYIATSHADGVVRLWNFEGQLIKKILDKNQKDLIADSVSFSPDGKVIAVGYRDEVIRLWSLNNSAKPLEEYRGHDAAVRSVSFSADHQLASGSDDGTVRLWDNSKILNKTNRAATGNLRNLWKYQCDSLKSYFESRKEQQEYQTLCEGAVK